MAVNYNVADYIPDAAPSTQARHLIEGEFKEPIPYLCIYMPHLSPPEALEMKKKIDHVSHVLKGFWLDIFMILNLQSKCNN